MIARFWFPHGQKGEQMESMQGENEYEDDGDGGLTEEKKDN